jgi:hypothetical protein
VENFRAPSRRAGIVRLKGRTFADDTGPYLGFGATLFWAGWGFQHDRVRLEERNLATLAGRVDYIRVLGSVGGSGDSWGDRILDPRDPAYDATVTGLTDLAYDKYGLRVEWTMFGGTAATPSRADRETLVRRFASLMKGREHKIQHYEIANEGWQNGFGGAEGIAELRQLAQILRALTPNIVALTSPQGEAQIATMYEQSAANLVTMHIDRSTGGTGGMWGPVLRSGDVARRWPGAWTSNEPIGPQSSVAADDDPLRLTLAAGVTWLGNGAGYVLHTGAGVRGGGQADRDRGRVANIADVPHIDRTIDGINALRLSLPHELPNFRFGDSTNAFTDHPFDVGPLTEMMSDGRLMRAFIAVSNSRFVLIPLLARVPLPFKARAATHLEVRDPLTGDVREALDLESGDVFTLQPTDAAVLLGELR